MQAHQKFEMSVLPTLRPEGIPTPASVDTRPTDQVSAMSRSRSVQLALMLLIAATDPIVSQNPAPKTTTERPSPNATIQYVNKQFGFRFALPRDWNGYTIVMSQWSADRALAGVTGPILSIRNPRWTEANPWQDIPIMIFTHSQWSLVNDGSAAVSAAPYEPGEVGRNRKYVFALPPRYNIDEDEGYREVIEILNGHPLHPF